MKIEIKGIIEDINFITNVLDRIKKEHDEIVKKLEVKRKSTIITLFIQDSIDLRLVTDLYLTKLKEMMKKPCQKLEIILDSSGGYPDPAYHLIKLLRKSCTKELNFIVPRYAKSGATFLALGGDKIFSTDISEFGPLDVQMQEQSKGSIFTIASLDPTFEKLHELIVKDRLEVAKLLIENLFPFSIGYYINSEKIMRHYVPLVLMRMFKDLKEKEREAKVQDITEQLISGYTHHGKLIDIEDLKGMGIKIFKLPENHEKLVWQIYFLRLGLKFYEKYKDILEQKIRYLDLKNYLSNKDPVLIMDRQKQSNQKIMGGKTYEAKKQRKKKK